METEGVAETTSTTAAGGATDLPDKQSCMYAHPSTLQSLRGADEQVEASMTSLRRTWKHFSTTRRTARGGDREAGAAKTGATQGGAQGKTPRE